MTLEEKFLTEVRKEAQKKLMGVYGVYKICDGDAMRICHTVLRNIIKNT